MSSSVPTVHREFLRGALVDGIGRSSLRSVAHQVGLSASGLRKFLRGADPMDSTVRKAERWYALHGRVPASPAPPAAYALLMVLLHDLPPRRRPEAVRRMLRALEDVHRSAGADPPEWVGRLGREA